MKWTNRLMLLILVGLGTYYVFLTWQRRMLDANLVEVRRKAVEHWQFKEYSLAISTWARWLQMNDEGRSGPDFKESVFPVTPSADLIRSQP